MSETVECPYCGYENSMEHDDSNVKIERFENVYNPKTKESEFKWRFVGYSRNVRAALEMIVNKELLIDKNSIQGLETHLQEVRWSNQKVLAALRGKANE